MSNRSCAVSGTLFALLGGYGEPPTGLWKDGLAGLMCGAVGVKGLFNVEVMADITAPGLVGEGAFLRILS